LDAAVLTLRLIDPKAVLQPRLSEGAALTAGDVIATLQGKAQSLLMAERVMLNFLGPLSGIASLTARYVEAVKGTEAKITCTRKTTPGLRALQKKAVRLGGGCNHRFGLDDAILIKDNHVAAAGGIVPALTRAKAYGGHLMPIEVEVDSLAQLEEALPFAPTCIMLDNFSLADLRAAVARVAGAVTLEASGGVNLATVADIAATGVDYVSVGALTHSAPCLDLGLDEA
jgi:nicotinate-nucleotide pyrophosphorylase (carboxylating)